MAHEAGQKLPPSSPQLKKRLRSIVTMIVGRETKAVISWVVYFRVRVIKISASKANYLKADEYRS